VAQVFADLGSTSVEAGTHLITYFGSENLNQSQRNTISLEMLITKVTLVEFEPATSNFSLVMNFL
jgi:hypothetical protein